MYEWVNVCGTILKLIDTQYSITVIEEFLAFFFFQQTNSLVTPPYILNLLNKETTFE